MYFKNVRDISDNERVKILYFYNNCLFCHLFLSHALPGRLAVLQLAVSDAAYLLDMIRLVDVIDDTDWMNFAQSVFCSHERVVIGRFVYLLVCWLFVALLVYLLWLVGLFVCLLV